MVQYLYLAGVALISGGVITIVQTNYLWGGMSVCIAGALMFALGFFIETRPGHRHRLKVFLSVMILMFAPYAAWYSVWRGVEGFDPFRGIWVTIVCAGGVLWFLASI